MLRRTLAAVPRRLAPAAARAFATAPVDMSDEAWTGAWHAATAELRSEGVTFEESAGRLRELLQTGLLTHTDLKDHPGRFFEAHRILARHAVEHGPGFWIRFTVHYNLFAGTVLAVGGEQQLADLEAMLPRGELGCFGLTEVLAGVQSGLVVNTTATWCDERRVFELHTPDEGAAKNWISQGYTADKAVVLADLRVGGSSHGPHAFVMDLRTEQGGAAARGVSMSDMGRKTTGNDLDNARISFERVELPHAAMLDRYAAVEAGGGGQYVQKVAGVPPFAMIGQRLYTGRVAVAQAALSYSRRLFELTRAYAEGKAIPGAPGGGGGTSDNRLAGIPQLKSLFLEAEAELSQLDAFVGALEQELSAALRLDKIPDERLVEAIATAKVRAVERSIGLCFRLKQEVGSFALMADAGFAHLDFLQCCKFAEGDSRILMQKMARDRLKAEMAGNGAAGGCEAEAALCARIGAGMAEASKAGADRKEAWDAQWEEVYELAELVMGRVMSDYVDGGKGSGGN